MECVIGAWVWELVFLPDAQRQTYTRVSKITFSPSAQKQALIPHIIKTQKKNNKSPPSTGELLLSLNSLQI